MEFFIIQLFKSIYNITTGDEDCGLTNSTMATAHLGTLNSFNPTNEPITSYLERVQLFFAANSVSEGKQVPTFLSIVGPAILRDLFAPALPSSVTLADIFERLKKHYEPKRATIVERYHFHKRDQLEGETATQYDAALRKLATHCQFADYLEEALRDRFVCGLRDGAVQRRLLSEKELSLAMDLAVSMEAAEKNTRSVKGQDSSIKKIKEQYRPRSHSNSQHSNSQQSCYRCGKTNHAAIECKFKDAICHTCGHIAPVCRSMPATNTQGMQQRRQRTNLVQQDSSNSESEEYFMFKLSAPATSPIEVTVEVEGKLLTMAVSIVSDSTRRRIFPDVKLRKSNIILKLTRK